MGGSSVKLGRVVRCAAIFCMLSLLVGAAEPKVSTTALAREAELIVRGTVESKTVQRDAEKRIYTELELKPVEVWKGKFSEARVKVVYPGGVLGEEYVQASGQPDYAIGEEVVLFLTRNPEGKFVTIGLGNGKFTVSKKNGVEMATNPNVTPSVWRIADLKAIASSKP